MYTCNYDLALVAIQRPFLKTQIQLNSTIESPDTCLIEFFHTTSSHSDSDSPLVYLDCETTVSN
jgi:hypothetical protein